MGCPQDRQLSQPSLDRLMKLPFPYDQPGAEPPLKEWKGDWKEKNCTFLDGYAGMENLVRPQTKEEEEALVNKFLKGMEKIFSQDTNRAMLQPLLLSFEYCAKCHTCSESCHVYQASGKNEIYRPIFRSEIFRRIAKKYLDSKGNLVGTWRAGDGDLNWETVARLGELAYRCNLCRRCAQTCPLGLDNALLAREIRKIFSQEMGIAPKPLHEKGTMLQLKTGSTTGMTKPAFLDVIEFIEDEIEEKIGKRIKIPIDKKGADILLMHNAGEFMAWPENPAAFAILFEEAGLDWTLSSELMGYDSVNYGVWYDDFQAKQVAEQQFKAAKELGVQRIVLGECGHAHRATAVSMDRSVTGTYYVPRESFLPLLWDLVKTEKLRFDPAKNNFPVTLHDPCNYVRSMGIVMPQRHILKAICPQFREMTPHGVNNYCCGGGGGFAIMNAMNFAEFRKTVSIRMKFKQILDAFADTIGDGEIPKYVCAPCSNCKGAIRDMLEHYGAEAKYNLHYGGLVELMVNALVGMKKPYLEFLAE
ncbi:4Fe-4S ferredoxin [Candidatus Formimonas warabiya]|uniref:4Fe-4S ferredoxin n=2 Tax=Formimonas warabiya TaxID=1761012 RepID=A0A3G1L2H2_FORW1|nr:4Fe-4S ferredoxin [Candidatus Formimonas warabiya]